MGGRAGPSSRKLGWSAEGYANWQADGLENRCPKGLVGSSPTPSAPSDLGFRVGITHALQAPSAVVVNGLSTTVSDVLRRCSPDGVAKRTFGTLLEPCRVGREAGAFEDHKSGLARLPLRARDR